MEHLHSFYDALPSASPRAWGPAELSIVLPLAIHWAVALMYESFDAFGLFQQYRLLQPDEYRKNKVTKLEVVRGVLVNQAIIVVVGWIGLALEPGLNDQKPGDPFGITQEAVRAITDSKDVAQSPVLTSLAHSILAAARIVAALFVYDTWQYWVHLALHMRWAYSQFASRFCRLINHLLRGREHFDADWRTPGHSERIHIWHHLLNAPWSYAATYVHPFESFLLDALGPAFTCVFVGLTAWERVAVFTLSVLKTLDDHSGYRFPWDPIIFIGGLTGSDIVYHTVHHQSWGVKSNYALWFTFWDRMMGTIYNGPKSLNLTPQFAEFRAVRKIAKTEHVE
ncbi:Putative fatty acid hydroxylase [Colletotrichum destructivum]|uniref:Fatty acid hydroxylase n=1 Tax=Colletotrichum destructivum TaxID=34406 RepID=A0AAX4ICD0_9PEZI|nr:Putative fatty acid hydroxylase [Colletotrichum destructivum]